MPAPHLIVHQDISVELIHSNRRKTMALQIRNGKALIRMPKNLPRHFAENFISQKYHWIKQKLAEQPELPTRNYADNEQILFLGQPLTLQFEVSPLNKTTQEQNRLIIKMKTPDTLECRKKHVSTWLRKQAKKYCTQRLQTLSNLTGLTPTSIKVRSYKARWGCCSIQGEIRLNWKLIMAPPEVIDYVLIHELCHLRHHNHSKAFWQLVRQFEPKMDSHRNWLKQNGLRLEL